MYRGRSFEALYLMLLYFEWYRIKLKDPRANVIVLATREILVIQIIN